ncbi:thymidylate kinase family protein [Trichomonas vaginalis G3]|uniref:Thymidylate kinase n=1 Tax=Trichomonas vaginalis (strain ATCC PRA-98 / G3) TaxID=412133 RepID=A2FDJ5_TRIV3|nr:dTDP metabolic process [Trichomonas vaginalis G3]EAX97024.1 thymidylate kinase family protein [Trichomonas vaginalis G3]KAI5521957.1 dTDP metabolic process [Trichomonas vaginalis G3]|eukprot:XP_001309954.1 thymidylate kinase family protein [Trichomonas vaginalis G3]
MSTRGKFILFEGCDGSGKSTQCKLLANSGLFPKVEQMCFPDRTTEIGQMINAYLKKSSNLVDEAIHLLFTANRWELSPKIKELLNNGTTIICDRYYYSGVVYSAAKGMDVDWCLAPEKGLPQPDLVIFIDISPEVQAKRKGFGEEIYEKTEFQNKVRELFLSLKDDRWRIIDGNQPLEKVSEDIQKVIKEYFSL